MTTITPEKIIFSWKTHFINEIDKNKVKNEIKNDDWYRIDFDNFLKNV